MMRLTSVFRRVILIIFLMTPVLSFADSYYFDFTGNKKGNRYVKIDRYSRYTPSLGYGYDIIETPLEKKLPFYFYVQVPDGNYRVEI